MTVSGTPIRFSPYNISWVLITTTVILTSFIKISIAKSYRLTLKKSNTDVGGTERHKRFTINNQYANNLHGKPGQGYYVEVNIGTPKQKFNVLVDTGSANFAIAAVPNFAINQYFNRDKSSTYKLVGKEVYVPYTQGHWKGILGSDIVTFDSLPNAGVRAEIACIETSKNFFISGSNWTGILGLGYKDIARPDSSVTPYFDSLTAFSSTPNIFSMQLCGTVDTWSQEDVSMGGTLIIGDTDTSLYTGEIFYASMKREWYYDIIITDIQVNKSSLAISCKEYNNDKTIVDSGTTNLRLPVKVYSKLLKKIKQTVHKSAFENFSDSEVDSFWRHERWLCWNIYNIPWTAFPTISIYVAANQSSSFKLDISPQQYLRALAATDSQEEENEDCFKFAISASSSGTVIGAVVMEGYYVIFDRQNEKVGFAKTTCSKRDATYPTSTVSGFYPKADALKCAHTKEVSGDDVMIIVAYVMGGVCGICAIPLMYFLGQYLRQKWKDRKDQRENLI